MKVIKYAVIIVVVLAVVGTVLLLYYREQQPTAMPDAQAINRLQPKDRDAIRGLLADFAVGTAKKDSPPSIDAPQFDLFQQANVWLLPDDVVFGVVDGTTAYAFPQRILAWHQVANITLNGAAAALTYCPLTGTTIGYFAPGKNDSAPFGVSGRLANSNLVIYDRKTDSYWPQILGRAIQGPLLWQRLEEFPVIWTTWGRWSHVHPDTRVLSRNSGSFQTYGNKNDPYGSYLERSGYYFNDALLFTPVNFSQRLASKEIVVGVRDKDNNALAVPMDRLRQKGQVSSVLGGRPLTVNYDADLDSATAIYGDTGEWANAISAMWFAWYAFYPGTAVVE